MNEYIELPEQEFKFLLLSLLQNDFNRQFYDRELSVFFNINSLHVKNYILMYIANFKLEYRNSPIRALSVDYFINCLYELYGSIEYDFSYDKYLNKFEIGDYILSGSCILSKYEGKSKTNRYKHKLSQVGGSSVRYIESTDLIKYTPSNIIL